MIRHALTIEHVARVLNSMCVGATLEQAWSQEKNTCYLEWRGVRGEGRTGVQSSEYRVVFIDTDEKVGAILVQSVGVQRARKNTLDVFKGVVGRKCSAVTSVAGDRILTFEFGSVKLSVLMYSGGRANVVVSENGIITDALHDKRSLIGKEQSLEERPLVLGKHYERELEKNPDLLPWLKNSRSFYVLKKDDDVVFSLMPLREWSVVLETNNVFDAIRKRLSLTRNSSKQSEYIKQRMQTLQREQKKLDKSIAAMQTELESASRAEEHKRTAELLMSQPNPRQLGSEAVRLTDWDGNELDVKLDARLSLIENAQRYFEKARKAAVARTEIGTRIRKARIRKTGIDAEIESFLNAPTDVTIAKMSEEKKSIEQQAPSPYRVFELGDGYTLYVGKNAANNDQLTMKFAKQNDWWFHARGESGSHAVLRGGAGSDKPPKKIIEAAASVAAYYSGSRNASWTPVVYTQRKYVRKPKGANIGAVVLDKEQTIMVKPALPTS